MFPQVVLLTTGLIALLLILQPLSDQVTQALDEAEQVAAIGQTYQLELALELYYLEHGTYPQVSDADLAKTLHDAGVLKRAVVPGVIHYHSDGQAFELALR